ncbi:MAG: SusC/RagA family TonB-linked outer membrane protein, partial [Chitinophagales bacterium]|nr:SusC/RagA family TonB-linked outer membrane protein [Chitinophagales bacterium]
MKFHIKLWNFSTYRNRINSLPSDIPFITIPSSTLHTVNFDQETSRSAAGQPIGSFYGYEEMGIFQSADDVVKHGSQPNAKPGDLIFKDLNGDGIINGNDRTFIGSPLPKFTYGFNGGLQWKTFDFSLFIQGSYGNKIYDLTRYYGDFFNLSAYNKNVRVMDAWSPTNTNTSVPRLSLNDPNNNIRPSSY